MADSCDSEHEINSDVDFDSDSSNDTPAESSSDEDDNVDINYNPVWSNRTLGLREIPFTKENKLLVPIPGDNRPVDWFFLLLDEPLLESICKYTNKYALELFCGPNTTDQSRITRWRELTVPELKIFLGLLLHTGTIKLNRLQDYWRKHRLLNLPCFREYMSRDRFLLILRCINFSKIIPPGQPQPTDRLYKIRELIDYFNNKMASVYYPSRELSIDESMVLWRGRLTFRQYIKNKRHKYGVKLYSVTEPDGLIMKFLVYAGADDEISGQGHSVKVVMKLMERMLNNGHSLYLDNFYNSFHLAATLLQNNTYCTGTLQMNRKLNPEDVKNAVLRKGDTVAQYAEGVMIGKWRDKRLVMYISTEFENDMVTVVNKRKQEKQKPNPIVHYNAHMKGIDRSDQMMAYHPFERKTVRWYKKIFIHLIQMITTNAFHLYNIENMKTDRKKKIPLYDFRFLLLEELLPPKAGPAVRTPPQRNTLHRLVKIPDVDSKGSTKRKRCRQCSKQKKKQLTTFMCSLCPESPGLCAVDCFDLFHRQM